MTMPGLAEHEAERRLLEGGPNRLPARRRVTVVSRVIAQLGDPLVLVLLAAVLLTIATGDVADTVVIALVVVANTTVGVVQEVRADRAVTALAGMTVPTVRVRRGGQEQSIPSVQLVPGDVVLLAEGDVVPADGRVVQATSLLVDESALTGESVPVGHRAGQGDDDGGGVSAGTVVVKGRAVIEVTRTGEQSALGRIAALTDVRSGPTPLQRRMAQLGRLLATTAVALCALVLALGLLRGEPVELMLVTAISLAVAAVPESLPAVVALSLAMGARRMASRRAIVRRLPAVETLGSVTVLATDKTGTLTQARMVVEELWTPQGCYQVAGDPADTSGGFLRDRRAADPGTAADLMQLLEAAALCNDAVLTPGSQSGAGLGDPTEMALLVAAARAGVAKPALDARCPRIGEVPFDSVAKQMTTMHAVGGPNEAYVVRKGSPEALARRRATVSDEWLAALQQAESYARRGYRVLAVEGAHTGPGEIDDDAPLSLLGLIAMDDPAKAAARGTIAACHRAGITTVLITGDHPATAAAVAVRVGIIPDDRAADPQVVTTGDQIAADQVADLTRPRVFARTRPEHKLQIVSAWQDRGAVVAMTGDGVNDGPALRKADIGVAMGHRGTEVARQAADMVLADDELTTVEHAIEEGRRVYTNIRRFLVFGLSGGTAEILLMLVGPFTGLRVPLLAAQILWLNLLTHGLTGVAIGAEPVDPRAMSSPPRPPEQSVLGSGLWQRVLLIGSIMALTGLGVGLWSLATGRPWQSMIFVSLTCMQLGAALGIRTRPFTRQNPWLLVAVAGSFTLALAGVYLPVLQDLLTLQPLSAGEAGVATATGLVGALAVRLTSPGRREGDPGHLSADATVATTS